MTHDEPETVAAAPTSPNRARSRARGFFLAALALFLLWVAALVGLAIVSGYRPMDRAGTVPSALAPDVEHEHAEPGAE